MTSLLIQAINNNHFEEAFQLINENKGNIINEVDDERNSPLHLVTNFSLYFSLSASVKQALNQLAMALLEKGANPNCYDQWGSYPIHYVITQGNFALIKQLIDYGADYNAKDLAKETPLHQAVRRKYDDITEYLFEKEDLQFIATVEKLTPLDYAKCFNPGMIKPLEKRFEQILSKRSKLFL